MFDNLIYFFHIVSMLIWVGGMFFAYHILRPAVASLFEGKQLLILWERVFNGFFPWVWGIVLLLPLTGYSLLFSRYQGFSSAPVFIHVMHGIGLLMVFLFCYLFFKPFKDLKINLKNDEVLLAKNNLARVREIVGLNTALGFFVIFISTTKLF